MPRFLPKEEENWFATVSGVLWGISLALVFRTAPPPLAADFSTATALFFAAVALLLTWEEALHLSAKMALCMIATVGAMEIMRHPGIGRWASHALIGLMVYCASVFGVTLMRLLTDRDERGTMMKDPSGYCIEIFVKYPITFIDQLDGFTRSMAALPLLAGVLFAAQAGWVGWVVYVIAALAQIAGILVYEMANAMNDERPWCTERHVRPLDRWRAHAMETPS